MANNPLPEQRAMHNTQDARRYHVSGYAPAIHLPPQESRMMKRPRETFEYEEPARSPTSTRRYTPPAATTTTQRVQVQIHRRTKVPTTSQQQPARRADLRLSRRALLWTGAGMGMMGVLCIGVPLVANGINAPDPQATYQVDAVVGHHDDQSDPSHFLAFNLNHHIDVIEMQGGDPNKTKIYTTPAFIAQGNGRLHIMFRDVNGDRKADMIITENGSTFVFLNDGDGFRPARSGELHGNQEGNG